MLLVHWLVLCALFVVTCFDFGPLVFGGMVWSLVYFRFVQGFVLLVVHVMCSWVCGSLKGRVGWSGWLIQNGLG